MLFYIFVQQYNSNVTTILATYNTDTTTPKLQEAKEKTTIGWTGTHSTMKYLSIVEAALVELSKTRTIEFLVICNAPYHHPKIETRNIAWTATHEISDLKQIDIGLYPLEKEKNLNQIIESNKAALNAKVRDLEKAQELLIAENQSLKAKLEFAPDVPRPSESMKKSNGVLDQDIF